MKKIKYISLVFVLVSAMFLSCKKTPDMPPVHKSAIGGTLTIAQLRALFNGSNIKFTQDVSLYATVTMTDNYKTLYIRDNTGAISLKQLTAHGIFEGDSLRINLNGSTLDLSGINCSLQIDSVDVSSSSTNKVVKLAIGREHAPVNVSILQLLSSASSTSFGSVVLPLSMYDGELVQVNDVQFSYIDSGLFIPINNPPLYLNHAMYDCGNLHTINLSLFSGTADFINQKVPHTQSGSMVAAVTFYSGALQLTPRSFNDIVFTQSRCGVDTLTQNFFSCISGSNIANVLPGWYDVAQLGNLLWVGNGSSPSGYIAATNYNGQTRNVMWLISPAIKNNATTNLNFQTEYVSYSSPSKPRQLSVMLSTDFNGYNFAGAHPAHWTDISSQFNNLMNCNTYPQNFSFNGSSNPVMLNSIVNNVAAVGAYNGSFYIGFKYMGNNSTTDSTQTFIINNFSLKN